MVLGFWHGKRILVTGGRGFVATHLVDALVRRGAAVTVTVRRPLSDSVDGVAVEVTDLPDARDAVSLCARHDIDTVFHLAATSIVGDAADTPLNTLINNVQPTLNLLEAARVQGIPRMVVASSDKAYGDHTRVDDPEPLPYREHYALRALDVYGASKAAADLAAQTYAHQYELPVVVVRNCNVYGPGDLNFSRLIPRTLLRLMAGQPPVINLGNADVLREYLYVTDLVDAYLHLAEHAGRGESAPAGFGTSAYNVGSLGDRPVASSDPVRSASQLIASMQAMLGTSIAPVTISKPATFIESPDQFLNSQKLHDTGYVPTTAFDAGLAMTVDWYRDHQQRAFEHGAPYLD